MTKDDRSEILNEGSVTSLCSSLHTGLWAVVNNAGVSTFGEVEFTSVDTYKQVSEVNLWGTIRVTKAVLPLIRRAKGKLDGGVFLVSMTAAKLDVQSSKIQIEDRNLWTLGKEF